MWVTALVLCCVSSRDLRAQTLASAGGAPLWPLVVTPLLSGAVAIIGAFVAIRFDARKTVNQELIRKRISIYETVAPKLNDLLCFFLLRGAWKPLPPPLMVQRKRELDRAMHVYGPLFSSRVFQQYNIFIHLCFKTFTGVGRDASLRANHTRLQSEWGTNWKSEWDDYFAEPSETSKNRDIVREYDTLLTLLGARQHSVHSKAQQYHGCVG